MLLQQDCFGQDWVLTRLAGLHFPDRTFCLKWFKTCIFLGFGGQIRFCIFPQQRKLMGSSAQISSGVCRCGSQEQVPEEGSGGRFQKVPESSGMCWCRFWRQLPEGSGGFRRVPVFRKVQESSGVVCCLATLTGAAMRLFLNPFW